MGGRQQGVCVIVPGPILNDASQGAMGIFSNKPDKCARSHGEPQHLLAGQGVKG